MTDEPYPPLRPQPGVRRRHRTTPWALLVGIVVLAVLAAILLVILLTRGTNDGAATVSITPSASASVGASPASSPSASAGAGATTTPAPGASDLALDMIVATTVEGLTVRAAPGLDAERLGSLQLGAPSFVVDGPTDADGYRWYLVSALGLPPNSGCAGPLETDPFNCPTWFGWTASASEVGDPWLIEHEIDCPEEPPAIESLAVGRTGVELLACLGPAPITVRGWWPEVPDDADLGGECLAQDEPSGWLLCQSINGNRIAINEDEGFSGSGIPISINPASGLTMPDPGTWVEVRIHLDDPAAQDCDEAAAAFENPDRAPEQYVLDCRTYFVVEAVAVVDGQ